MHSPNKFIHILFTFLYIYLQVKPKAPEPAPTPNPANYVNKSPPTEEPKTAGVVSSGKN